MKKMGWTPQSAYKKLEEVVEWTLKKRKMAINLVVFNYFFTTA